MATVKRRFNMDVHRRSQVIGVVTASLLWACPAVGKVVISEFRTRGPNGGNDEFIELYNAGAQAVDIGGYKVKGSSKSGTVGVRATIPAGTVMGPGTFYLLVNTGSSGYSGTVLGDQTYASGIADDGGLALTDAADTVLDAVGMSSGSAFQEGTTLTPTTTSKEQSYERKTAACGPDQDTDDNAADFQYNDGSSNPQNSASCRLPCAGDPCVTPPAPWCQDGTTLNTYPAGECAGDEVCEYPLVPVACEFGCDEVAGACKPDPCEGVVCETPPNNQCYEATGTCSGGVCSYDRFETGTDCDDGNACTELDHCDNDGTCAGAPVVCPAKGPECLDPTTSRTYSPGTCNPETGDCVYEATDTVCEFGCDGATGLCLGDPCATVTCDAPPSECYATQGTCSGGTCSYAPLAGGTPCDDEDSCTLDDQCDGAGGCAGTPDPGCVPPPDGGEDVGPTPGDAGPTPDDAGGADPGPPEGATPDAAGEEPTQADGAPPPDAILWPDTEQDAIFRDAAGGDAGVDAGPTPIRGGGGSCSAATGGNAPATGWLALLAFAAWGFAARCRTRRSDPRS